MDRLPCSVLQDEDFAVPGHPRTGWREFGTHRVPHDAQDGSLITSIPFGDSLNGHAAFGQRKRVADAAENLRAVGQPRCVAGERPQTNVAVADAVSQTQRADGVVVVVQGERQLASMPRPPDICALNSPGPVCGSMSACRALTSALSWKLDFQQILAGDGRAELCLECAAYGWLLIRYHGRNCPVFKVDFDADAIRCHRRKSVGGRRCVNTGALLVCSVAICRTVSKGWLDFCHRCAGVVCNERV